MSLAAIYLLACLNYPSALECKAMQLYLDTSESYELYTESGLPESISDYE